jgi:hypothetical protein
MPNGLLPDTQVGVGIHKAGKDIQICGVDNLGSLGHRNIAAYGGDFAVIADQQDAALDSALGDCMKRAICNR